MNKEFNETNYQAYSHQEGQQNNIARDGQGRGLNEPPMMNDVENSAEQAGNKKGDGQEAQGKTAENKSAETESDRANENEDEGVRGGNSSI